MSDTKVRKPERWRHFYLYAKYHYERTDVAEDLKTILAHECALPHDSVNPSDIIYILSREAWRHMKAQDFAEFLSRVSPDSMWRWAARIQGDAEEYDFNLSAITTLLGVLSCTAVFDEGETLIELGEPDFNILPESESRKKWRAKREAEDNQKQDK